MEIASVVDSVGHLTSQSETLAAQELNPDSSALSEKEDYCDHAVPPEEQMSLLGNDKEIQIQKRSLDFVSQGNNESSGETEPVFLSSNEAPVEGRPLPSAEVHDEDIVSYDSCSSNAALPVPAPEVRSDHVNQNITGQILPCEPKGYVCSLESSLTFIAHPNGLAAQTFPPVPRIVNHKQSSITFLDYTSSSDTESQHLGNGGSDNGQEKHDADETDDYDDDVFTELPVRGELFVNHRCGHREIRCVGSVEATTNCGRQAEEEVC